jgi:heme A synthase
MNPDTESPTRIVPRWLRAWSVLTALAAGTVVVLGSLITTFRVGMSDPVWPTEPWFLVVNSHVWVEEPATGFLIEHTHRFVAWGIGLFAAVLAFGAWATEPDRNLKWRGLIALTLLLLAYLGLHGEMGAAWRARKAGGELQWPLNTGPICALAALGVLAASVSSARGRSPGRWFRVVAALGLVAVMIQGLLGGYRVFLDQLMGTQLAAIHGSFGQVTLALLTATVVLSAPRRRDDSLPLSERFTLSNLTVALVAGVVLQLVWGVWVRHLASPVAQRLHILTAFVVVGLVVAVLIRVFKSPPTRSHLGGYAWLLGFIVVGQLVLGVEAYLGKFALTGPEALKPPELRAITSYGAVVRTAHTLLGAALLTTVVTLAVRVARGPAVPPLEVVADAFEEPAVARQTYATAGAV